VFSAFVWVRSMISSKLYMWNLLYVLPPAVTLDPAAIFFFLD